MKAFALGGIEAIRTVGFGGRRGPTVFLEPGGGWALAGDGGVGAAMDAESAGEEPFEAVPEMETVKDGIEEIGGGAVMDVFGIGVVDRMVVRGLQDADVLKKRNDGAVFLASAVFPFVDFVGVGGNDRKEPDRPAEKTEGPSGEHEE